MRSCFKSAASAAAWARSASAFSPHLPPQQLGLLVAHHLMRMRRIAALAIDLDISRIDELEQPVDVELAAFLARLFELTLQQLVHGQISANVVIVMV